MAQGINPYLDFAVLDFALCEPAGLKRAIS
jgi:hypothetical protein